MRKFLLSTAFIATGIGIAACGSSSTGNAGNANSGGNGGGSSAKEITKPCNLLTTAEVEAALQKPAVTSKEDISLPTGPSCSWTVPSDPNASISSLDFSAVNLITQGAAVFNGSKSAANPQFQIIAVSGVGDDAFIQVDTASSGTARNILMVMKSGAYFQLTVESKALTDAQIQSAEKTLGAAAAGRI
jgi:hypothetical protein